MTIPKEIWEEFFNSSLGTMDQEKLAEALVRVRADLEVLRAELFAMIEAHTGTSVEYTQTGYWPPLMTERREILTFLLQKGSIQADSEGEIHFRVPLYDFESEGAREFFSSAEELPKDSVKVYQVLARRVEEEKIDDENREAQGEG